MCGQTEGEVRALGAERIGEIHCVTIIGQVEGHQILGEDCKTTKYEHILPLLAAAEESVAAAEECDCREEKADCLDRAHGAVDDDASATPEPVEEVLDGDMPLDRRGERQGCRDCDSARNADEVVRAGD